ncbi:MAG TPA: tetratricopeptide repeat protein, partial [Saprospiraceae bacterium]|nr:tetratricopeptide repeat protein [Saprospiraceae bacterium]
MSNSKTFDQLFKTLKHSSLTEIGSNAGAIMETFLDLDREQIRQQAEAVYAWAEQQAAQKPLVFIYGKLLRAFSYFYTEQYDKALPELTELQRLFEEQHDPDGLAVTLNFQGSIYRTFGNVDLALKACWSALEQLTKSGKFQFFLIANHVNIGGIFFDRKHYEQAIPHFTTALEMAEKMKKDYWIIYSLHGLGKVYLMQKKYNEAKASFEQAMQVANGYQHPLSVSNSLTELGNYYFAIGHYAEAEDYHRRSLEVREQHKLIGGAVTNCIRLGEIYIQQFKPEEAITIIEKGMKLAEQIQVKPKMYQLELLLSEIYQRKNDLVKSLFHYKRFHEFREQVE